MDRQRKIFIGKTIAILAVVPVLIRAHQAGPDPGHAGVPGEANTCNTAGCHTGTALNGGGGSITIDAGGSSYTPGGPAQQISVTLGDPKQRRWGFQMTARSSGSSTTEEGSFAPADGLTQVFCSSVAQIKSDPSVVLKCGPAAPLEYIEHTLAGAKITPAGAGNTWTFNWTPPATDVGPVILYVAGNAANADMDITGDHIYSTTLTLTASSGGSGGGGNPAITSLANGANSAQTGFAANGWVVINGTGLATSARNWDPNSDIKGNQLPTSLDGTSVQINSKNAYIYSISPTQVTALAPVDTALGMVSVQVTLNGTVSNMMTMQEQQFAPAFFSFPSNYIVATHTDGSWLGPPGLYTGTPINFTTPAKGGETILLYGTGFGPTTPGIPDGQVLSGPLKLANTVTFSVGGVNVVPNFAGLSFAGGYQFSIKVPNTVHGDVPVIATIGGVSSPAGATINVQ